MSRCLGMVLLLVAGTLAGQNSLAPKQHLSSIAGQVVVESAGTALRKVSVTLVPSEGSVVFSRHESREPYIGTTDAEGRFQIQGIEPGEYRVSLERSGFLSSTRRSRHYSSTLLSLAPGQELQGLLFRMRLAAVIKGKIVDEDGDPVQGVNVTALSLPGHNVQMGAMTNDLGDYRIAGLSEGKFLVEAQPQQEMNADGSVGKERRVYAPTYYPGTLDQAQAVTVEAHAGDEAEANINLLKSRIFTLKGRVFLARAQSQAPPQQRRFLRNGLGSPTASIVLERADGDNSQSRGTQVEEDGAFEIQGVLPGSYNARVFTTDGQRLPTTPAIEIRDADIDGIQLTPESATQVRGRFRMDESGKLDTRQVQLMLDPEDPRQSGGPNVARIQNDGSFTIENVQPGNYHVVVTSNSASLRDYIVKEVNVDGKDVGDSGFAVGSSAPFLDVVASAKGSTIEGTVADEDGKPIADVPVVCIPDAARRRRHDVYQTVQTDQRGYFSVRGLNPGEYQVFALDDAVTDITDPEFISSHAGQGETVKVEAGERKSIVLKLPTPQD